MIFYLRVGLAILGFFGASAYGVLLALVRRDRSRVAADTAQALAKLMRPPLGIRTRVIGRENMTAQQPCIYIANHQSAYDVPVFAELYPEGTAVIGKKELRRIPFFGWLFHVTGNVLIDRKNRSSAVGRLREAEEAILNRGVSIWIFPEGTRGEGWGQLLPLKKGAFYMSAATGAPLVPIVMEPLKPHFDPSRRHLRATTLEVRVLPPVAPKGSDEAAVRELLEEVQARMQNALSEMSARQLAEGVRHDQEFVGGKNFDIDRSSQGSTGPPV